MVHPISAISEIGVGSDAILNCVGFGTPDRIRNAGSDLFTVSEEIDDLLVDVVRRSSQTKYVNFSSGAVYGVTGAKPAGKGFESVLNVSPISPQDFYRICKTYQEAKHRSFSSLPIVDLRLFSFFSPWTELESGFLLTDIIGALSSGTELTSSPATFYRDYVSPEDLYLLLDLIIRSEGLNRSLDVYSREPIEKFRLLDLLREQFGLRYTLSENVQGSPTGNKSLYYSTDRAAGELLGYSPVDSSWDSIRDGLRGLGFSSGETRVTNRGIS